MEHKLIEEEINKTISLLSMCDDDMLLFALSHKLQSLCVAKKNATQIQRLRDYDIIREECK